MVRYFLFRVAGLIAERAPKRIVYALAWLAAEAAFLVNSHGRSVASSNIRHVLGATASPVAVRRVVRGCFHAAAAYYADLARTPKMRPAEFFAHNVTVSGLDYLTAAVAGGRGVIAATIHYGNPEYVGQCLSSLGISFMALVEPLDPPALAELFRRYRSSQGQQFVDADVSGVKQAIRHLRRGGLLAVLVDRDIQHRGVEVTFFGAPAQIPTGAVDLALHTGAVVLPLLTRRIALDRFEAVIEPPLELIRTGDEAADRRRNTERLIQRFEPYLRRDPSQWFVLQEPVWSEDRARLSRDGSTRPSPAQHPRRAARRARA
jgi:lauroyl/myristoyl acyltransferase